MVNRVHEARDTARKAEAPLCRPGLRFRRNCCNATVDSILHGGLSPASYYTRSCSVASDTLAYRRPGLHLPAGNIITFITVHWGDFEQLIF